jgi:phosphonate transport system substrate-binding protein
MTPRTNRLTLAAAVTVAAVATVVAMLWLGGTEPAGTDRATAQPASGIEPVRIGLIPERDIFEQRRRYMALADYISAKLGRPVELVTSRTYDNILDDFRQGRLDAAFLGSLMTVLTVDRLDARVLVKPRLAGGIESYRGVIFVAEDAPVQNVEDLSGRSIAMVRATTAGNLFPIYELMRRGLLPEDSPPPIVWVGTHDEVLLEVLAGRADAGALKDLRLESYLGSHPEVKVRRLASSDPVPENALVIRADVADSLGRQLQALLLGMVDEPQGRQALADFGAERFMPCAIQEYEAVYMMIDRLGEHWRRVGVEGPPPRRLDQPDPVAGGL